MWRLPEPTAIGAKCGGTTESVAAEGKAPGAVSGAATGRAARPPPYMYLLAFCAALNSTNDGFDMGVGSGVSLDLQHSLGLTDLQVGLFFGCLSFTSALGGLLCHPLSDYFGRRYTFVVAQVFVIVGIAAVSFSQGFPELLAGRIIMGVGVGIGFSIDPLYIAEVAPAAHRGEFTSWCEVAVNVGITLGFLVNLLFRGLPRTIGWRVMVGAGSFLPLLLIVLAVAIMPESPRWLVSRGRSAEAARVLRRTHPEGADVEGLVREIEQEVERAAAVKKLGWSPVLRPDPVTRMAFIVGLGVAVAQQVSGEAAVIFYMPRIFEQAGVGSSSDRLALTLLVGLVKTFFVIVAGFFLDRRGRRPLLLMSVWGMCFTGLLIALGVGVGPHWLALVGVISYVAAFSLGIGPIVWIYGAELFPSHIRAKAMGLAVCLNRSVNGLVTLTFLPLSSALGGQDKYFFLGSAIAAASAVFLYALAPETKQQTLEQLSLGRLYLGQKDRAGEASAPDAA